MVAETYKELLASFNAAFDRLEAELSAIQEREQELRPGNFSESYQRERTLGEHHEFFSRRKEAAKHVFGDLVRLAETRFSPAGTRLSIETCDIDEHFSYRENDFKNFDPVTLWAYLTEAFGSQGEDIAYTQAADPIMAHFYIEAGKPIKTVSGQIVLDKRVWIDSIDKKYCGTNKLSHSCVQELQSLCYALSSFASWADDPMLAGQLKAFARDNVSTRDPIQSRARFPLGALNSPSVMVTTYTTRFEFRFSPETGLLLQEFLGLYASKFKMAA